MQENEFEKQVKDAMENLRFSPAAPVWDAIKKHIQKKRRRIWPFFLLLIAVALFSGYFIYVDMNKRQQTKDKTYTFNNNIKKEKSEPTVEIKKENNKQLKTIFPGLKTPQASKNIVINKKENARAANNYKAALAFQSIHKKDISLIMNDTIFKNQLQNIIAIKPNNTDSLQIINNKFQTVPSQQNNKNLLTKNTDDITTIDKQPINGDSLKNNNTVAKNDSAENNISLTINNSVKNNNAVVSNKSSQPKKTTIKLSKTNKWQWGITTMYGKGNLTNNISLNTEKSNQSTYVNNPGTAYNANTAVSKNPYTKSNAYSFGVVISKKIFKQSYLSSGLNFVHLSNTTTTAINLDSSLIFLSPASLSYTGTGGSSYYRLGSQKTYTNRFNFIELPVSFESSLFHLKQFSLLYNAGLSVRQLLSSNALIYDSKNNTFLSNNGLIKRTQFQLLGGLNLQLTTKHAGSFLIGPHVEYSLSKFVNTNYNHLHFINYDLQATWLLHKK